MDALAAADVERLRAGLEPLVDGYTAWLDAREADIPKLPTPLQDTGRYAVDAARRVATRIRAGIAFLTTPVGDGHTDALAAFRFANFAMAEQRRRTELARRREEHGWDYTRAKADVDAEGSKVASWQPFQLAFVLFNLPALTDPAHAERSAEPTATVDLLFFPTGCP